MIDVAALLGWCLRHIQCDACQTEGAEYVPEHDRFICAADQRLMQRFSKLPSDE